LGISAASLRKMNMNFGTLDLLKETAASSIEDE
jgi:hypothetical protein